MIRHVLPSVMAAVAASTVAYARCTSFQASERSSQNWSLKYGSKRTLLGDLTSLAYRLRRGIASHG